MMTRQEVPSAESIRSTRQYLAGNEAYLREEYGGYANAKKRAETLLSRAGGNPDVSSKDHARIVEARGALLVGEIGRATERLEKQALAQQLRELAAQVEDASFDAEHDAVREEIVSANDQIAVVELMLLELRGARRRHIEELRQVIDVTSDQKVILECCALIEEDIASSLAAGDTDGVRRSTASLAAVRALIEPKLEEESAAEQELLEYAHSLAASIVGDRNFGVPVADARWFERALFRHLSEASGPNRDRSAVHATLAEYRARNARLVPPAVEVDLRNHFVESRG